MLIPRYEGAVGVSCSTMSDRAERLEQAFTALNGGDPTGFEELFAEHGQWLGFPGSGIDGATPI